MNALERSQAIIQDILVNHLPRIKDGLERGYVDENQILVMYDHAVRARILREHAGEQPEADEIAKNREFAADVPHLQKAVAKMQEKFGVAVIKPVTAADRKVYNYTLNNAPHKTFDPTMTGLALRTLLPEDKSTHALYQETNLNNPDIEIADNDTVEVADKYFYSVPPATFGVVPTI